MSKCILCNKVPKYKTGELCVSCFLDTIRYQHKCYKCNADGSKERLYNTTIGLYDYWQVICGKCFDHLTYRFLNNI